MCGHYIFRNNISSINVQNINKSLIFDSKYDIIYKYKRRGEFYVIWK